MTRAVSIFVLLAAGMAVAFGQKGQSRSIPLDNAGGMKLVNVRVENVEYRGRKALRVTDAAAPTVGDEGRMAILPGSEFRDGVIEAELSGDVAPNAPEGARGFVGIAFRAAADVSRFECIYLRPTNGRADDQVRRNHSVQYISFPGFPWQRLRKEFPEKYETYVDLVPGEWTKARIEVSGQKARLYVHGSAQPVLLVNDLRQEPAAGSVALWVGPGTVAHFSNLRITAN